jgi:hypothetical protein
MTGQPLVKVVARQPARPVPFALYHQVYLNKSQVTLMDITAADAQNKRVYPNLSTEIVSIFIKLLLLMNCNDPPSQPPRSVGRRWTAAAPRASRTVTDLRGCPHGVR